MDSKTHFLISGLLGIILAWHRTLGVTDSVWIIVYAAILGTAIDLDHFVISRLRTGSWSAFRRCVWNPSLALLHQQEIFRDGEVGRRNRLVSHLIITGGVLVFLLVLDNQLVIVSGIVLVTHVISDLVHDRFVAPEPR